MKQALRYGAMLAVIGWLGHLIWTLDVSGLRSSVNDDADALVVDAAVGQVEYNDIEREHAFDIATLAATVRGEPTMSGSYMAMRAAADRGDYDHAARYAAQLLDSDGDVKRFLPAAIRYNVLAGHIAIAIDAAKRAEALDITTRDGQLILFVDAVKRDDQADSIARLDALKSVGIQALYKPFLQSWIGWTQGKELGALHDKPAMTASSLGGLLHYHNALQYHVSGNESMARASYELALSDLASMRESAAFSAISFFTQVGDKDKALSIINALRNVHARDVIWHARTPEALLAAMTSQSLVVVDGLAGGVAEVFSNIGGMIISEHVMDEAQILLQLAAYLRDGDVMTQLHLAAISEERGLNDTAISQYQAIDAPDFIEENIVRYIARSHHDNGDVDAARDMLQAQKNVTASPYHLYVMLGDIARHDKNYQEAANYFSSAVNALDSLQAGDWPLLYRRAVMYDMGGSWEQAEADLEHALQLQPDEPELLNYLGYSWITHDMHLSKAEDMLKRAIALDDSPHIVDSYGWALYHLGRYDEALEQIELALSQLPGDPTINDHYGDILWVMGRETEARYHWERALQLEPVEDGAEEKLRKKLDVGLHEAALHK